MTLPSHLDPRWRSEDDQPAAREMYESYRDGHYAEVCRWHQAAREQLERLRKAMEAADCR